LHKHKIPKTSDLCKFLVFIQGLPKPGTDHVFKGGLLYCKKWGQIKIKSGKRFIFDLTPFFTTPSLSFRPAVSGRNLVVVGSSALAVSLDLENAFISTLYHIVATLSSAVGAERLSCW
jgi:hypothetical protein